MNGPRSESPPPVGLRERKKARTRAAIQHEALRLFCLQGYETTTMEEIAAAAEVSPSTLFRYFPSKEALVLTDDYDPLIVEACRSQPAGLDPIQAVRRGLRSVFEGVSAPALADMRARAELALSVPGLRAAMLEQLARAIQQLTAAVAERTGRGPDDFPINTLAGAVLGVMIAAELYWVEHAGTDLFTLWDEALAHLEEGLPL